MYKEPIPPFPLVSIVIPCYNHEDFVQDCIESIIKQTYQNIELIIIDDGSRDSSVDKIRQLISKCEHRFVRFEFRNRDNKGLSNTLNEALKWCQGKYYSPIASDDIMLENKTQIQVDFLEENRNVVAVFGGVELIDNNNHKIDKWLKKDKNYHFEQIFMHEHDLPAPTAMMRLDIVKKVGGYPQDLVIEDWYMWLKLSKIGDIYYMSKILCLYRRHDNNLSKNIKKICDGRIEVLNNFKNDVGYNKALTNILYINLKNTIKDSPTKSIRLLVFFILKHPMYFVKGIVRDILRRLKLFSLASILNKYRKKFKPIRCYK